MNMKLSSIKSLFAVIVILLSISTCYLIYFVVFGNPLNFQGNDPTKQPLPGNYFGIIYKGGLIVPVLMSFVLICIVFGLERFITISRAYGKGSLTSFVSRVKSLISNEETEAAKDVCNIQRGALASAVDTALRRYKLIAGDTQLSKGERVLIMGKEIEDAMALELPVLEKNLNILATLASISTLVGLLGTVIGMVKAFAALASSGSPDATALANGISEALINTALGIGSSALAILFYNYFTSRIDTLTENMDEIGMTLIQNITRQKDSSSVLI